MPAICGLSDNSAEIRLFLDFRNWLREHPEDRNRYAAANQALTRRNRQYPQDYADAKVDVVRAIKARMQEDHSIHAR